MMEEHRSTGPIINDIDRFGRSKRYSQFDEHTDSVVVCNQNQRICLLNSTYFHRGR